MSEASRIADFMRQATRDIASKATRSLALQALSGLVLRTPVDTGRARGGWGASIGAASGGDGRSPDKSGAAAIAAGSAVIGTQQGFQMIVLDNNVPYIGRLNDGHSGQAPKQYVESTLASLGLGVDRE